MIKRSPSGPSKEKSLPPGPDATRKLGLEPPPSRGTSSIFLEEVRHSYDKYVIIGTGVKENACSRIQGLRKTRPVSGDR